jgi:hypothetical protein
MYRLCCPQNMVHIEVGFHHILIVLYGIGRKRVIPEIALRVGLEWPNDACSGSGVAC